METSAIASRKGGSLKSHMARAPGEPRELTEISQGCPTSPILFVVLMGLLKQDAAETPHAMGRAVYETDGEAPMLCADSALQIGAEAKMGIDS